MPTAAEKYAALAAYHQAKADLVAKLDDKDFLLNSTTNEIVGKLAGQLVTFNLIPPAA